MPAQQPMSDEQLIEQQKNLEWEQTRQNVINQTQGQIFGQLRSIQITLAIGVGNNDFSAVFRNDIRTLLLQMAVALEASNDGDV